VQQSPGDRPARQGTRRDTREQSSRHGGRTVRSDARGRTEPFVDVSDDARIIAIELCEHRDVGGNVGNFQPLSEPA